MIPIDGEKLKEVINELRCIAESQEEDIYQSGYLRALGALSEDIFIFKRAEFPPGTLIIQREEGHEKRSCCDCVFPTLYYPTGDFNDGAEPGCAIDKNRERIYEYYSPSADCKYHITESELKAAYIVGGEKR